MCSKNSMYICKLSWSWKKLICAAPDRAWRIGQTSGFSTDLISPCLHSWCFHFLESKLYVWISQLSKTWSLFGVSLQCLKLQNFPKCAFGLYFVIAFICRHVAYYGTFWWYYKVWLWANTKLLFVNISFKQQQSEWKNLSTTWSFAGTLWKMDEKWLEKIIHIDNYLLVRFSPENLLTLHAFQGKYIFLPCP